MNEELRDDWRTRAACGPTTAHLFGGVEAEDRYGAFGQRLRNAQRVCRDCPVKIECFELAEAERLTGVFGGVYVSVGRVVDASQVRVAS